MRTAFDIAAGVPWLITPDGLEQILSIASRENLDMAAVERLIAERELSPEAVAMKDAPRLEGARRTHLRNGVAVINITGPIFRYSNLMTLSGATSLDFVAKDFQLALQSPEVGSILLNIDSPGGQAAGVAEFANAIRAARELKPIVAYASHMMASAAYWIGSAASEVVLSTTSIIGSVGAVMSGSDTSMRDAAEGVRRISVVSRLSPKKHLDPASRAGADEIQDIVDALAERFALDLARNRGIPVEKVLTEFGQGGVIARPEEAVRRRMADRIGAFEELIGDMAAAVLQRKSATYAAAAAVHEEITMEVKDVAAMTAVELAAANPKAVEQIKTDAHLAGMLEGEKMASQLTVETVKTKHPAIADVLKAEGRDAAITAERERISKITSRTLPGHTELSQKAISAGTSFADFLDAQTAAEQAKGPAKLAALRKDELEAPKVEGAPSATGAQPAQTVDTSAPIEQRAKTEWDKDAALRAEFGNSFDGYLAYRKADENGQVKRYTKA